MCTTMRDRIEQIFSLCHQEHLIADLGQWSAEQLSRCLQQLNQWKLKDLQQQQKAWDEKLLRTNFHFRPLTDCRHARDFSFDTLKKKTAVVVLAGGQGSRLGFSGPKGCFHLLGQSLFERICRKMQNAPLAILTSVVNHLETQSFFHRHQSFGLSDISFFSQNTLPLLNEQGHWFWQAPGILAEGADGNGSVFRAFHEAGLTKHFFDLGVETVHIVPVDNPLSEPLDPVLSGVHDVHQDEITMKGIQLQDPLEPMGRIVKAGDQLKIVEFAELSETERQQCLFANTGLWAIDLSLMSRLAVQEFPFHWVYRSAPYWEDGETVQKKVWKAERFITDALDFASKSSVFCDERDRCYAPLKEKNSMPQIEKLLSGRC